MPACLHAGVVVRRTYELRVTVLGELDRPVLRILAEGGSGGHVAEQERAGAARLDLAPVRVEVARPLRRHGAPGQALRTGGCRAQGVTAALLLAEGHVGLEVELGVLLAVRRRERFLETPRVDVRRDAGGPFLPVRGPVEVEVAVLEDLVQTASHPVRRCRRADPVV